MTMNVAEVLDAAAQEQKRIVKILKKWISWVDDSSEKEIYFDMITWVEQKESSAYYKKHAATMRANIHELYDVATDDVQGDCEKAVFNFISRLIEAHGGKE